MAIGPGFGRDFAFYSPSIGLSFRWCKLVAESARMSSTTKTTLPGWVIVIVLALIPLISSTALPESYLLPRTLLWALVAVGGTAFWLIKHRSAEFTLPIASLPFLGLILWSVTGLTQAYSTPEWILTASRLSLYAVVTLTAVQLFRSGILHFRDISRGLSLFAGIGALLALRSWASADDVYDVFAPFGHKNFTSAALLIGLLGSLYGALRDEKPWKYIAIASIALATLTILLLRTRGVWIGAIASTVFIIAAITVFRPAAYKKHIIPMKYVGLGFGILLTGFIAILAQPKVEESVLDDSNINLRFMYWEHSLEMFSEEPITGVGLGQWKIHFPKYGLEETNLSVSSGKTAVIRPHNDYIWFLSETGLPGALLYIGFWGWVLLAGVKQLRSNSNEDERAAIMAATAMVVAFLSYAMGEFPIERVDIAVPVFIAAGYLLYSGRPIKLPSTAIGSVLLLLAVGITFFAQRRMNNEHRVKEILDANDRQAPDPILTAAAQLDESYIDMDMYGNPIRYFTGLSHLAKGNRDQSLADLESAIALHPWHVVTLVQYGNWYKLNRDFDRAQEIYERGLGISRRNITLRLNRAEIEILRGNHLDGAKRLLQIFGEENNPKYQGLMVRAFRALSNGTSEPRIENLLQSVNASELSDKDLFMAILQFRNQNVAQPI